MLAVYLSALWGMADDDMCDMWNVDRDIAMVNISLVAAASECPGVDMKLCL